MESREEGGGKEDGVGEGWFVWVRVCGECLWTKGNRHQRPADVSPAPAPAARAPWSTGTFFWASKRCGATWAQLVHTGSLGLSESLPRRHSHRTLTAHPSPIIPRRPPHTHRPGLFSLSARFLRVLAPQSGRSRSPPLHTHASATSSWSLEHKVAHDLIRSSV